MSETNHIQETPAYCLRLDEIVELTQEHYENNCFNKCPYLRGSNQGKGIECFWDDGTDEALSYLDPEKLQKLGKKAKRKDA